MKRPKSIHDYYDAKMQRQMKLFHKRLSEKDHRSYAALEAKKLGDGGINVISELFECSRDAIHRGIEELENPKILPEE